MSESFKNASISVHVVSRGCGGLKLKLGDLGKNAWTLHPEGRLSCRVFKNGIKGCSFFSVEKIGDKMERKAGDK